MLGIKKVRYPTTQPPIIISNQKTDIPPEELYYMEKEKEAKQLQEPQELSSVSCVSKNVSNFIAGNLKSY